MNPQTQDPVKLQIDESLNPRWPTSGSQDFSRRRFFKAATVATAGTACGVWSKPALGAAPEERTPKSGAMVDTNVWLSRWPFRRLPWDEPGALVAKLSKERVTQAWAGSFDGMFHKDLASANARLAEDCRKHGRGLLLPFGSVNPMLPDWKEELRRCHEVHRMRGIRLHPNYNGYKLDQSAFSELLNLAIQASLIVQIALSMEDERMQHPLMQVPHVDVAPLVEILKAQPKAKVVLLNWFRAMKGELRTRFTAVGQVFLEIATVEGVGGIGALLKQVRAERVLFGSYSPFFYFESAALKLKEAVLSKDELSGICAGNAAKLLAI